MYNTYAPEADVSDYVRWLDETTDLSGDQWVALFEGDEEIYDEDRLRFYLGESHTDDEHHFNTWTGDQSVRFVEEAADDGRPFFLHAGFFGPHQPMLPPEPWASMYDPDDVELMPEFYADHDHRPIFENYCSHRAEAFREQGWTEETFRSVLAAYYGQISQIDHQVGRIVEALKQMGVYDDTLFIFTADHGDHNGQFGMLSKGTMYEASARVPLVIAGPGVRSGRRHEPVNNIGLYGTVLDYHGIEAGDAPAGTLRPLLGGRASEADTSVYSCLAGRSLLRRDDIKLIRQDPGKLGPDHVLYEMYDLSDGREMENIYDDPVFAEVRADLQKDLDAWHEQQMAGYRR
jgi:arylsulfatase A-like enzyme